MSEKDVELQLESIRESLEFKREPNPVNAHEDERSYKFPEKEYGYSVRRHRGALSPDRADFVSTAHGGFEDPSLRTYSDIMKEKKVSSGEVCINRERKESFYNRYIKETKKQESGASFFKQNQPDSSKEWDILDERQITLKKRCWDETPESLRSPSSPSEIKSRWDETPQFHRSTSEHHSHWSCPTVYGGWEESTPTYTESRNYGYDYNMGAQNQPFSDEDLDSLLPKEGYIILEPPIGYVPIRTPSRKLVGTPISDGTENVFSIPKGVASGIMVGPETTTSGSDLPLMKPEDFQYFSKLVDNKPDDELSMSDIKERKIMRLLLKIKNGTPPMRKSAFKQITERARELGAGPLFDKILSILMSPSLEDQERHLLVKVIGRILYKLEDLVRPYVHKILVVIGPLLIDEDYYARMEGREIISNLSKAAGLASMISSMRPDIDSSDEYVRNTTARAFSVVASSLGIPALLPFIKAVCQSRKRWETRHTGIKIVQQIAILTGCGILPHLNGLIECIYHGVSDEKQRVRTITALALSALAEAAYPYGIESFEAVLKPLWKGIRQHRGKSLTAFLKAAGYIIPLMDVEYANYYSRDLMPIIVREFSNPDEEMKRVVLEALRKCISIEGTTPEYVKTEILPDFFKYLWVRRMVFDRRSHKQLVETTVELAAKVGPSKIIGHIVIDLKDELESYRKVVMEVIARIITANGCNDINERLEERLVDCSLYAFQEQSVDDNSILDGFGIVINSLGMRIKRYIKQICSTILWRLNNKSSRVRQQASDLIAKIAPAIITCGEETLLSQLGLILYEYLGEEYPDVLGSVLGALKSIAGAIGMENMSPPIRELLPRLTPILKNRHEKVQENCIDLVGRIADHGSDSVSPREWMRICFELLDMLKAHKKSIRRSAISTFGYIARAIGPHDVLCALLSNLKVQERQNRICTTVAIAIVSETCSPFTVLPALMNEYRVPELNVQNGVLKSISFLFEYISEIGKDYIYAVAPLLEDALIDRDIVHRQTACTAVKHMALGVIGLDCEDVLIHLLNYIWPNIFETSPHMISATLEAIEALSIALGPSVITQYLVQGMFHPARRVRNIYWIIYNNLYVRFQDALVACYPRVDEKTLKSLDSVVYSDKTVFLRSDLELML